jgi:hypothetical protein
MSPSTECNSPIVEKNQTIEAHVDDQKRDEEQACNSHEKLLAYRAFE